MKYVLFFMFVYLLMSLVYAGPQDKWVYVGSGEQQLDGIALVLGIATFVWLYFIYRDYKVERKVRRRK